MTEAQLQQAIVDTARLFGWLVYHAHDSRHSAAGFPDLCMVKPPRLVFAELKTETGKPSPAQLAWAGALELVSCKTTQRQPEVYLWRPADWRDGSIDRVLRSV